MDSGLWFGICRSLPWVMVHLTDLSANKSVSLLPCICAQLHGTDQLSLHSARDLLLYYLTQQEPQRWGWLLTWWMLTQCLCLCFLLGPEAVTSQKSQDATGQARWQVSSVSRPGIKLSPQSGQCRSPARLNPLALCKLVETRVFQPSVDT